MNASEEYQARPLGRWLAPADGQVLALTPLWITRSGDSQDHLLPAGSALAVSGDEDLLIEALHGDTARWRWLAALPASRQMRPRRAQWGPAVADACPAG